MDHLFILLSGRTKRMVSAIVAGLLLVTLLGVGSAAAQEASPDWSNISYVKSVAEGVKAAGDHAAQVQAFEQLSADGQQAVLQFIRLDHLASNKGTPQPVTPRQKAASSASGFALHGRTASIPKGLISARLLMAAVGSGSAAAGDARYDSGCWQSAGSVEGQDAFGYQIWEFDLNLWWCGDGTWITDYNWWISVSTSSWAPLWQYEGLQDSNVEYGFGWSGVQVWAQGEFDQCAAWCFDSVYPEVTDYGGGDGNFFVW